MKIAIDAMGGDKAPKEIIAGAINAAKEFSIPVILVGNEAIINSHLKRKDRHLPIEIQHAEEVIEMHESPAISLRKKRYSSIKIATDLVKNKKADAVVSAGNTGAVTMVAKILLGSISGSNRPAIAQIIPTQTSETVLLDVGATVDCKPKHLVQFAFMGAEFVKQTLKRPNPRIGLLNIGEEASKGNSLTRQVHNYLSNSSLNFIGNIEGRDIFRGKADVIVCDGFMGNVTLKLSEGVAEMMATILKRRLRQEWLGWLGYLLSRKALKHLKSRIDYSETGGAPLLGVNGVCIICHGGSSRKAIKNAIRTASQYVETKIVEHLKEALQKIPVINDRNIQREKQND